DNTGGQVAATGALTATTSTFVNDTGLLQARGPITLDTRGQALVNTHAGSTGGIVSDGAFSLAAGVLDNRSGLISSGGAQTYTVSGDVDNAGGDIHLSAANLHNG